MKPTPATYSGITTCNHDGSIAAGVARHRRAAVLLVTSLVLSSLALTAGPPQERPAKLPTVRASAPIAIGAARQSKKNEFRVKHPEMSAKLDSQLIALWNNSQAKGTNGSPGGEKATVILQNTPGTTLQDLASIVSSLGARIIRIGDDHVKAEVPVIALEQVAKLPGVASVRTPMKPHPKNTVLTEGRAAMLAAPWHAAGFRGQGVKIAIIDVGFVGVAALKAADEIPASAIEMDFSGSGGIDGGDYHGAACAEIVYDMAPNAQLYLIRALDASDDQAAVNYCRTQGIHIINASSGYDALSFHDGVAYSSITPHPVTTLSNAVSNGILWVNSAGNEQVQHASVPWRDVDANLLLDWDPSNYAANELWNGGNEIPAGQQIDAYLTWNNWPTTAQDFDLDLYFYNGSAWEWVVSAEDTQNGTQPPFEHLSFTIPQTGFYALGIYKYSATTSPRFILRSFPYEFYYYGFDNATNPVPGSVCIPGDAAGSFTVGAIDAASYASGPIEWFSSLGPNNGAYTGKPVVMKPDICGPDRVSTSTYGNVPFSSFDGTSASAPHIAGLAALVKSRYPGYTNSQIRIFLESCGKDLGAVGRDNTYGFGACVLPAVTAPPSRPVLSSLTKTNAQQMNVRWTAPAGYPYTLQVSSNLLSWTDLISLAGWTTSFQYTDPAFTTNKSRFYRVRNY